MLVLTITSQLPNSEQRDGVDRRTPESPNFLLFNQEVTPLAFVAKSRAPHAPVSEIEKRGRAPQGAWTLRIA